jgi:hypothetical protein
MNKVAVVIVIDQHQHHQKQQQQQQQQHCQTKVFETFLMRSSNKTTIKKKSVERIA